MGSNWKPNIGLKTAEDCGYLSSARTTEVNEGLAEIGRMLNSMMSKADQFCSSASDDH